MVVHLGREALRALVVPDPKGLGTKGLGTKSLGRYEAPSMKGLDHDPKGFAKYFQKTWLNHEIISSSNLKGRPLKLMNSLSLKCQLLFFLN